MRCRVFLSTSSRETERIAHWTKAIRANDDLHLVSTWQDSASAWAGKDATLPRLDQANRASRCIEELCSAHVVFCIWSLKRSVGSAFELGVASARGIPVIAGGRMVSDSIYSAAFHYRDHDEFNAFHELLKFAQTVNQNGNFERAARVRASERPWTHA